MTHKHYIPIIALICAGLFAGPASADCYLAYKAKKDNPLQFHYGIMQLKTCSDPDTATIVSQRLQSNGWTLLRIVGEIAKTALNSERDVAGAYFLRY